MYTLNITNGMVMYEKVKNKELDIEGLTEPFNEAMCEGDATENIFGSEFRLERAATHIATPEEYEEIVITPLTNFFMLDYDRINLYFDSDMFCQMNLLTILGYLDKNEYDGKVALYLIDYDYTVLKNVAINPKGFYSVYKSVLIDRTFPEVVLPETLLDGVIMYLSYKNGTSPIHEYILNNKCINREIMLTELMEKFPEYGLGDAQLLRLFDELVK